MSDEIRAGTYIVGFIEISLAYCSRRAQLFLFLIFPNANSCQSQENNSQCAGAGNNVLFQVFAQACNTLNTLCDRLTFLLFFILSFDFIPRKPSI